MKRGTPFLMLATAGLMLGACEQKPTAETCPPDAAVEALHAASYWLEREPDAQTLRGATLALAAVSAQEPVRGPAWHFADRLLKALRKRDLGETDWRYEVEKVRMELQDWPCMPEALHEQFHARLDGEPPRLPPVQRTPTR